MADQKTITPATTPTPTTGQLTQQLINQALALIPSTLSTKALTAYNNVTDVITTVCTVVENVTVQVQAAGTQMTSASKLQLAIAIAGAVNDALYNKGVSPSLISAALHANTAVIIADATQLTALINTVIAISNATGLLQAAKADATSCWAGLKALFSCSTCCK